jgi:hypothetical protein
MYFLVTIEILGEPELEVSPLLVVGFVPRSGTFFGGKQSIIPTLEM